MIEVIGIPTGVRREEWMKNPCHQRKYRSVDPRAFGRGILKLEVPGGGRCKKKDQIRPWCFVKKFSPLGRRVWMVSNPSGRFDSGGFAGCGRRRRSRFSLLFGSGQMVARPVSCRPGEETGRGQGNLDWLESRLRWEARDPSSPSKPPSAGPRAPLPPPPEAYSMNPSIRASICA